MFRFARESAVRGALCLDTVKAVLFDLDGTLIDVEMQRFVPAYVRRLAGRLTPGADPERSVRTLHAAVMSMLETTSGESSLEALLRSLLADELDLPWERYQAALGVFCREDLPALRPLVRPHPLARALVESCLARGWRVVLATNPIFPREVVAARLAWGGLDDLPFHPVTSYETSRQCKPHAGFFADLLEILALPPQACLMIGNDAQHDLAAGLFGLQTCLLTTWCVDRRQPALPADWAGPHEALLETLTAASSRAPAD